MSAVAADLLADTLTRAGIILPDPAAQALATLDALRAQNAIDPVADTLADPKPITAATAAKKVRDLATALASRAHIREAAAAYEQVAAREFFAAITTTAADMIDQLQPYFTQSATVVQRAGELLPLGATLQDAWAAGAEAVTIYEQLPGAVHNLTLIRAARAELGRRIGGEPEREVCAYIAAADGMDRLVEAHTAFAHHTNHNWHRLTAQGFTLQLNAPDAARKVEHAADHADNARAQQRDDARRQDAAKDPLRQQFYAQVLGG